MIPMKQSITINTPSGTFDEWGEPTSQTSVDTKARIDVQVKFFRNKDGQEVVGRAIIYLSKKEYIAYSSTLTFTDALGNVYENEKPQLIEPIHNYAGKLVLIRVMI